jgi:hypothetical protein
MALIAEISQPGPLFRHPQFLLLPVFADIYQKGATSCHESYDIVIHSLNFPRWKTYCFLCQRLHMSNTSICG